MAKMGRPKKHKIDKKVAIERLIKIKAARESFRDFCQYMMPDADEPDNMEKSQYIVAGHHEKIFGILEDINNSKLTNAMISMPPRHGKSLTCSILFPMWALGKKPGMKIFIVGYSTDFVREEFGTAIKAYLNDPLYRHVFPECDIATDTCSSTFIRTKAGGHIALTGIDGAINGRGADLFIYDDPYKGPEDADSPTRRQSIWRKYTAIVTTRMLKGGRQLIIMTRWHEDDIIGRLQNPELFDAEIRDQWKILKLPGVKNENTDKEEALWPDMFDMDFLKYRRAVLSPREWSALYQCNPTPDTGIVFTEDMIFTYKKDEIPDVNDLRIYMATDFAVTIKGDFSVILTVGVDSNDTIWILDCLRMKCTPDRLIDEFLQQVKIWKPLIVWGETGQISSSLGPSIRRAMNEQNIYANLVDKTYRQDKVVRSRSIQARMAMGKVKFPVFKAWWHEVLHELITFPNGTYDDFVDALSLIGMGLDSQPGMPVRQEREKMPKVGSINWVINNSNYWKKRNNYARIRN